MTSSLASILVFVAFALLVLVAVIGILVYVYGLVAPLISRTFGGVSFMDTLDRWTSRLRRRKDDDDDDDEDEDDLDDSTAALLSMMHGSSVVIDESDEVVRANPASYRLGVVQDDMVVVPEIRRAIETVRKQGGRIELSVTTATPPLYMAPTDFEYDSISSEQAAEENRKRAQVRMVTVSRPNWLNVVVGRINERFVVVMIDDQSESIRFAQTRDDFIENVSQQLLKPGAELLRLSDALERGGLSQEQIAKDARAVRRSTMHVDHLVSDLLLLIKAQEPIAPSAANLITVFDQVRAAVKRLADVARERHVNVTVGGDESVQIHGDDDQIVQALAELVDNAIEYSDAGSTVSVSVARSKDRTHVLVRVIDTGKGIPHDEQDRIFERFFRGSNQSERTGDGVGLGLAIVKHVALTHRGSVSVWSRPGQGSTFTLMLPVA